MKRILAEIPRKVLIALSVIVGALVLFAVLLPILGGAQSAAEEQNRKLKVEIDQINKILTQSKGDAAYVREHQEEFEALVKSDRLVPHTRRAAIVELQRVARAQGLTALNYSFNAAPPSSLKAAESQPQSGAYTVSVESIALKLGAPYDGPIYRFLSDISDSFPGSIVVDSIELQRAREITSVALEAVSRGQDSGLVSGDVTLLWRTAQAKETKETEKGK